MEEFWSEVLVVCPALVGVNVVYEVGDETGDVVACGRRAEGSDDMVFEYVDVFFDHVDSIAVSIF